VAYAAASAPHRSRHRLCRQRGGLLEDFVLQGGVDTSFIRWVASDGISRTVRNGLNFTERGFGVRGALGVSDPGEHGDVAAAAGDVDWEHLFGTLGVRWFHTGGIFAGLSETTPEVVAEAVDAASRHGTVVSYDLNYRASLWQGIGGVEGAHEVNRRLARHVDVMIGNEEDFTACLGLEVEGADENLRDLDTAAFRKMIEQAAQDRSGPWRARDDHVRRHVGGDPRRGGGPRARSRSLGEALDSGSVRAPRHQAPARSSSRGGAHGLFPRLRSVVTRTDHPRAELARWRSPRVLRSRRRPSRSLAHGSGRRPEASSSSGRTADDC
jgi:hypothetical protein